MVTNKRSQLYDDGSNRLRDTRPTDFHPPECGCAYCRTMCCVPCHMADPSNTKTWKSIQGFSRHIQAIHSEWALPGNAESKVNRIRRTIRAVALAKEQKRFTRQGLKTVPIKKFNEEHLKQIDRWVSAIERDPSSNLLLGAITLADERFVKRSTFESQVRDLTASVGQGIRTGLYVTTERKTHYDPRVALEVLKLCWTLGRGWSFVVHLLLLYGLNAFAENLKNEGISPPTRVRGLPEPLQHLNSVAKSIPKDFEQDWEAI